MSETIKRNRGVIMIIALIILWLLLGLLATINIRIHDEGIDLLCAILITIGGAISLFVIFVFWLSEIEI